MPSRTTSQPAEVAAFAAALDDFRRASGRAKGRLAADGDLTLSQYHLLEPLLSADEPLGVGELACAAGVSAPTATRMLAGLERDAFVERRACTRDRRVVRVALTDRRRRADDAQARPHRGPPRGALPLARAGRARAGRAAAAPARRRDRGPAMSAAPRAPAGSSTRTRTGRCSSSPPARLAYALAQTMIVPALPEIQRTFGGDPADATWLLTAFLLTAARRDAAVRAPRRHVRQGALAARSRSACSAPGPSCPRSPDSLGVMIAGRAIQGAGGAIFPLAIGIIRDEFPREKVATGIGTISAMFGIGGGVGLVVAGVLVDGIGVAWIFWLSAAAALLAAWATGSTSPSRPCASRRGSTGSAACCCPARSARCCSASARATRGAGPRPACSACSPRPMA